MKKNFNEIYEKIFKETTKEIENLRKKKKKNIIGKIINSVLIIICLYLYWLYYKVNEKNIIFLYLLGFVLLLVEFSRKDMSFLINYKSLIISKLVKGYRENFIYNPQIGISSTEYKYSNFDIDYINFCSEDLIQGTLNDGSKIEMSEVTIYKRTEELDISIAGENQKIFKGLYGYVKLKQPILNNIEINTNNFFKKKNQDKIILESANFEKKYELNATNKVHALKIFTPELIDKIVYLSQKNENPIEMKICNDKIYFRINCGDVFDINFLKDPLDYKHLRKCFYLINFPVEIVECIIENSKNV